MVELEEPKIAEGWIRIKAINIYNNIMWLQPELKRVKEHKVKTQHAQILHISG
jgi:hypothetical protein